MQRLALTKKKENITEYVIYMYQIEDLIRAYQFNLDEIHQYVISHYPISPEEKNDMLAWFSRLAERMVSQQIQEKGHLTEVQLIVDKLARMHWKLLKSDPSYLKIYNVAKPFIIDLVLEAGDNDPGHEIQLCFNAIYGLLLSRLHGHEVPAEMIAATNSFGGVLRYLAEEYHHQLEIEN